MYVIGVAGQAQMGKDTLADRLCAILNKRRGGDGKFWRRTAFASNVKNVISQTFGVSKEFIEEWKVKPEPPPDFDMNVRQSLQFVGDGFRKIRGTIWVDLMFREGSPKIISDVRYINEFRRVKKERGFNILVGRTDKLNDDPNGSEAMIRPYVKWCLDHFYGDFVRLEGIQDAGCPIEHMSDFDVFIKNDGTVEDLYRMVEQQLVPMVERFETSGGFLGG